MEDSVNDYDRLNTSKLSTENFGITQTWDEVGKNVVNALETTLT